jgi:hypothetical protein
MELSKGLCTLRCRWSLRMDKFRSTETDFLEVAVPQLDQVLTPCAADFVES